MCDYDSTQPENALETPRTADGFLAVKRDIAGEKPRLNLQAMPGRDAFLLPAVSRAGDHAATLVFSVQAPAFISGSAVP